MRVSILVPVFEEAATIGELLKRLSALDVGSIGFEREILVCDDASTDGSSELIADAASTMPGVRVFTHGTNRGKGACIRTLLDEVTGDAVLVQDADLEYEVEDAIPLLRRFAEGSDAVYGSRFLSKRWPDGMQVPNWLANAFLTTAANVLYGHRITDEATCLKLVRTSLLRRMNLKAKRFEFCPEVTAKLGLMGVHIEEVPVRYRARDVAGGKKIRWQDAFTALAVLLKLRFAWAP